MTTERNRVRKKVKHFHDAGHLHEFTFSCYKRWPLLNCDDRRRMLTSCIDSAGQEIGAWVVAFVFMPEHIHLLVGFDSPTADIGLYLARVKQPFSRQVKQDLISKGEPLKERLLVRERPGKTCFRFWQEGSGYDRNLVTDQGVNASIDYIHRNPVERGLCQQAIDWKWSSARWYICGPPRQQDPDLPTIRGVTLDDDGNQGG